jgi:hypothetical protein
MNPSASESKNLGENAEANNKVPSEEAVVQDFMVIFEKNGLQNI